MFLGVDERIATTGCAYKERNTESVVLHYPTKVLNEICFQLCHTALMQLVEAIILKLEGSGFSYATGRRTLKERLPLFPRGLAGRCSSTAVAVAVAPPRTLCLQQRHAALFV